MIYDHVVEASYLNIAKGVIKFAEENVNAEENIHLAERTNKWVQSGQCQQYVRISNRFKQDGIPSVLSEPFFKCLDLCNLDDRFTGGFDLNEIDSWFGHIQEHTPLPIHADNVLREETMKYLNRRGFNQDTSGAYPDSWFFCPDHLR